MRKLLVNLAVIALVVGIVGSLLHGQSEYASQVMRLPFIMRPMALVTNTEYQVNPTMGVDMVNYNTFLLKVKTGQAQTNQTTRMKYQWSDTTNHFVDEGVLTAGTIVTSEAPYTVASRVIVLDATNANSDVYVERVNRLGRYFRIAVKQSAASSTKVEVIIQPMVN